MRVKMTVDMSGTRNGEPWPPRGTPIDLPDEEAQQYVTASMAVPAGQEEPETATMPQEAVEKRSTAVTTRTGPVKKAK